MMNYNPNSCDKIRTETLQILEFAGPSLDAIITQGQYFAKVDDRSTTNNYAELIKDASGKCRKMSNAKMWYPINPNGNLQTLVEKLEFNWPNKAQEHLEHIKGIFNEIDESFQQKGLKPAQIPGAKQYRQQPPPVNSNQQQQQQSNNNHNNSKSTGGNNGGGSIQTANEEYNPILDDERLKNIDKKIAERILNEVVDQKHETKWDDIAGLENVKQAINEIVVYPMQNPELFQGLLAPAKGLLLFGPPGTGKTLIGKCIASESGATFFAISASSLTSKWVGEGEKMVRALFAVARCMQPSVVFIDEIDSLLTQRVDGEHDSSRRMKTEFLVQFDGVSTGSEDRLLIVGATNRPQELDEAARRRFTKRLYIPLPEEEARCQIIKSLMAKGKSGLTEDCVGQVAEKTKGYSGADMATLCKEAALGPIRTIIRARGNAKNLANEDLPPISMADFESALKHVKASVNGNDLQAYEEWDKRYGASRDNSE